MTPGFAYPDYEKGDRDELTRQYPAFAAMIKKLTRQYNRARQAQITKEIAEVIGGAEALK